MDIPGIAPPALQMELVGRSLRELRQRQKLSREEVAQRAGMLPGDLLRIEKGEFRVSLDVLFNLLAQLRVSGEEFLRLLRSAQSPAAGRAEGRHG